MKKKIYKDNAEKLDGEKIIEILIFAIMKKDQKIIEIDKD
jgi:hypothetical protein